jgi:hypothetical protein
MSLRTTSSRAISLKILRSLAAGLLVAVAACAHAQEGRFSFATQAQAREVLGRHDEYVRATAALERSALLRTGEAIDAERFAKAMQETALEWTAEEKRAFSAALASLEQFIAAMKWKAPPAILIVKASGQLMDDSPHTRGNAIVLPEGMLRKMLERPGLMDYLMAHEVFHVLSRADPALREELYGAIGFRACAWVDMPAPLAGLRLTNPDAPESRHAITVRRGGQSVEVLPFVHFSSEAIDPGAGFVAQMQTSWLLVDRRNGRCAVRAEGPALAELEGLYEQVGRNTGYLIHPEEILADNFALLFLKPGKVASPEILERLRKILH